MKTKDPRVKLVKQRGRQFVELHFDNPETMRDLGEWLVSCAERHEQATAGGEVHSCSVEYAVTA